MLLRKLKRYLRKLYVVVYPIFFLYAKKDRVEFLRDYSTKSSNFGKSGSTGMICEVKYFPEEGWFYHIDCGLSFKMVYCKDVKRISRGWVTKLKLRFTSIEDVPSKNGDDEWKVESSF